jgi:cytochrome oxidase Cu insertion factor (SCO1/SenC/PrrC family)
MPGMNSGLNADDPVVVAAFRSALLHQGLVALLVFAVLGVAWIGLRNWRRGRTAGGVAARGTAGAPGTPGAAGAAAGPEPAGRLLLVIGFGNLWLFDGLLQIQPGMPVGLPSQGIEPAAASSPTWVQHIVNWGVTSWSYHPVPASAAAVWIQVGLGIWLLAAPSGTMSRLAGLASAGWGLVIWVFGESFGGIFAPGLSWLSGAPGAAGIYVAAGLLIALPGRAWSAPRLGRLTLAGLGLFLAGMAVLQAWPGRGFWQGTAHGQLGSLSGMALSMAVTPQPGFLSGWLSGFAALDEAHGFAVNLLVVGALAVAGAAFLSGRPRLIRPVLIGFSALCLAVWVLVQDLGFLGGVGTDPNSMIPLILLATAGYLAVARVPVAGPLVPGTGGPLVPGTGGPLVPGTARPLVPAAAVAESRSAWRGRIRPAELCQQVLNASARSLVAAGAAGLVLLGAVPLALAQASTSADPILAQSVAGTSGAGGYRAPGFALTDQHGRTVTLVSLRGRVVLLGFFDPVCTPGCPPISQELRQAARLLAGNARQLELVGIVLSPARRSVAALRAFDRQAGLSRLPGWLFLTGTPARLQQVRQEYGIASPPAGATAPNRDEAYVIDRTGHVAQTYRTAPAPVTAAMTSSFAALLAGAARQALSAP